MLLSWMHFSYICYFLWEICFTYVYFRLFRIIMIVICFIRCVQNSLMYGIETIHCYDNVNFSNSSIIIVSLRFNKSFFMQWNQWFFFMIFNFLYYSFHWITWIGNASKYRLHWNTITIIVCLFNQIKTKCENKYYYRNWITKINAQKIKQNIGRWNGNYVEFDERLNDEKYVIFNRWNTDLK